MSARSNIWGGTFEIFVDNPVEEDDYEYDRAAYRPQVEEEEQSSWLLRAVAAERERRKRKLRMKRKMNSLAVAATLVGFLILVAFIVTHRHRRHHVERLPDNYTAALHQGLMFFNAQRSGRLPAQNNVPWRDNSCLDDGTGYLKGLVGGYYNGGDAAKYTLPTSFSITILSWSLLEYSAKYDAAGELSHIKGIIKWGTDYLLKTFNSSADSIDRIASQVGGIQPSSNYTPSDDNCWIRPEDINYNRTVVQCHNCPALAAEMAAALAAASIVFRDNFQYSKRLVHGAELLFKFATKGQGQNYRGGPDPSSSVYSSSGFWDEFVWGGAWLYCASGNISYLRLITSPRLARNTDGFWGGPARGVLSWDNKHVGAQMLLTRMRMFLDYGYPYEEMLRTFHVQIDEIMCSYLPEFPNFNRTKGGLILLNHGKPRPLQYAVNAAFLATLYSDYLEATLTPGWMCGPKFYRKEVLRKFARSQIDYILGQNPHDLSYIVGFGDHFPRRVHHRGASIPSHIEHQDCAKGVKWRDREEPNPNTIVGAMVAGPDEHDHFQDDRRHYNYTEPTIAGNAGLVAAVVALSNERNHGIDKNAIFHAIPPLPIVQPPPPPPWRP